MANFKFTPEYLYKHTNDGLDIIFKFCPDAVGTERTKRHFKLRADENTASANLFKTPDCWIVKDWGEKSYNPIALCRYFTGYSFIEALKYLYAEFNIGETDTFIKPNTTFSDTDLEPGHYEIIEASEYKNLDVVGRFLTVETAAEYDFIPVKEYSFVVRNKKTNRPALCKIEATDTFPIFAYKFESWAKIYQPMDRKFKHSYVGKKPHRHVFGLARLRKMHKAGLDKLNDQIQEAYDQGNDYAARDLEVKLDNYKLESVFICSGGSDGLNLASLGYNAIWYNSEAEQLNFEEWKELKSLCHNVYNLPDIDAAGIRYANEVAEKFWTLKTVFLPSIIKESGGKDFRDWLKRHAQLPLEAVVYQFQNLTQGALRMKFFTKFYGKNKTVQYNLQFEFLSFFLAIKGIYAYKIEQNTVDESAQESVIFIRIKGNVVSKISAREIRNYVKEFLRERGQPVELLDKVSTTTLLNESQLLTIREIKLDFKNYTRDSQLFFFQNTVVEVTADEIKHIPHGKIGNYVWESALNDHRILPEKPFFEMEIDENGLPKVKILRDDSEYFNYLKNASRVFWRKEIEDQFGADEEKSAEYREKNRFNLSGDGLSAEEIEIQHRHLANKLYAIGYLLHRYKQPSFAKLIAVMDDKEKDLEDDANGGSGKSLMFAGIDTLLKNRHWLDGKNINFKTDKHLMQGFTKNNDYLIIEDAHAYFDITYVYNWVTGSIVVNPKFGSPYEIKFDDAGKIVITTNYGFRSGIASTLRRLFFVTTSDYYHAKTEDYREEMRVSDDFGGSDLFKDWTEGQWNRHYNLLLQCLQTYLKFRQENFEAPSDNLRKNNTKAMLGDSFLSWAESYFYDDYFDGTDHVQGNLNTYLRRSELYDSYRNVAGKGAVSTTKFKNYLGKYCKSRGWIFNPDDKKQADGLIRQAWVDSNGKRQSVEHFFILTLNAAESVALKNNEETTAFDNPQFIHTPDVF